MFSSTALKIYALKRAGFIKSNAQFWREFGSEEKLNSIDINTEEYAQKLNYKNFNLLCAFDENYPAIPANLKSSEKPYLFAYKGNIDLLENIAKNIAVVGVLTPTQDIIERERNIIELLTQKNICIVSGLADGCDSVAHKECLLNGGKTIAFLPTTLDNIYPKKNVKLAEKIVQDGGLILTEYVTEPTSKYESVKRFIERDRLQAMFASKIILIASYLQGQGDSGSRHAMQNAKEYGKERFIMYNEKTDKSAPIFGLNRELLEAGATVLAPKVLNDF